MTLPLELLWEFSFELELKDLKRVGFEFILEDFYWAKRAYLKYGYPIPDFINCPEFVNRKYPKLRAYRKSINYQAEPWDAVRGYIYPADVSLINLFIHDSRVTPQNLYLALLAHANSIEPEEYVPEAKLILNHPRFQMFNSGIDLILLAIKYNRPHTLKLLLSDSRCSVPTDASLFDLAFEYERDFIMIILIEDGRPNPNEYGMYFLQLFYIGRNVKILTKLVKDHRLEIHGDNFNQLCTILDVEGIQAMLANPLVTVENHGLEVAVAHNNSEVVKLLLADQRLIPNFPQLIKMTKHRTKEVRRAMMRVLRADPRFHTV